jgi:20S proteasome alpha/beta subunit
MRDNKHIRLEQFSIKKHNKMTCIIGGRCKDGVVLVGDRKVKYDNNTVEYVEKIFPSTIQ